jgi:high-affinity nickel-transport protein
VGGDRDIESPAQVPGCGCQFSRLPQSFDHGEPPPVVEDAWLGVPRDGFGLVAVDQGHPTAGTQSGATRDQNSASRSPGTWGQRPVDADPGQRGRWAFLQPVRKVFYNLTITVLSVAVALVIGLIELLGPLATELDITTGPLAWIATIDLNHVGYVFVATWLVALAVWRFGRIERRWTARQPASSG